MGKKDIEKAKSSWLEEFTQQRPDLFFPDEWTDAEKEMALEEVRPARMKTAMFSSIPMTCQARRCPIADRCPLQQQGQAPKGKPCPYELQMVKSFMSSLISELNVDENNLTEVSMVRDLVDQEIQQWRATNRLGMEDFIVDNVIGVDKDSGEPLIKKELHIAVELQTRILKNKKDLRNQLLATREARAKIGQGQIDTAMAMADIFSQVRELELNQQRIIKQKLGMLEHDEYIDGKIIEEDPPHEDS